jgi:hypothetical protein
MCALTVLLLADRCALDFGQRVTHYRPASQRPERPM